MVMTTELNRTRQPWPRIGSRVGEVKCQECGDPVDADLAIATEQVPSGLLSFTCQGCYFKDVYAELADPNGPHSPPGHVCVVCRGIHKNVVVGARHGD